MVYLATLAPRGSRSTQHFSSTLIFFWGIRHKILKVKCKWDLLNPLVFQHSPAPLLLTPVSTSRYLCSRMGSTSCPHAQDLHLSCSCSGKSRWTEFPPEEARCAFRGPWGSIDGCWQTSQFFTLSETKCVAACMQVSSFCEFIVNFHLEGKKNNSSQTSPEKRLSTVPAVQIK